MVAFAKQLKMSSTKQKEIVFFFKSREKLQQQQQQPQQQQQNDYHPTEEIQIDSSDSMPEIAMNYQPHQPPETFKFPVTVYGKQKRSFQHHWFEKYPWLDYNAEEDPMACVLFERQNSNLLPLWYKEETFLKIDYKNWKKKTLKNTISLNFMSVPLHLKW